MWIKGNYRRTLLDMHVADWSEEFLSQISPEQYVSALKAANVQGAMVYAKAHTGLCFWPSSIGRMHKGLKGRDFLGETISLCHKEDISVIVYFTQIFDNWAYDNHPAWRCVTANGHTFREFEEDEGPFKNNRYGIVCPNNPEYRQYVRDNLQELNRMYDFEGMFLDMTFWPDICYCPHCRERYFRETGRDEMPRVIDWNDPEWLAFQKLREDWMEDFALFATAAVKEVAPHVTIEHQFSMVTSAWRHGSTEKLMNAVDYAGGDYYGGYLQQTFINKYYNNVSPALPFIYHTSRCDPDLNHHTTTKTREELLLHVITALIHNGAFLLVDAINPDGTICPEVYTDLLQSVFEETKQYEPYIGEHLSSDVSVWFSTFAKYDPQDSGTNVAARNDRASKALTATSEIYLDAPVKLASILRQYNIPFNVIPGKNLKGLKQKVLALSHVAQIRDDEMDAIEAYVRSGGNLYVSGVIGHPRLAALLGIRCTGMTEHDMTYMRPTEAGASYFEGFSAASPLTIDGKQILAEAEPGCEILATLTLPYTKPGMREFASIHSNPPGIHTDSPAMIRRKIGEGTAVWSAAPIEIERPFMSRNVVYRIIDDLCGSRSLYSNAPSTVEVLSWEKGGKRYTALVNQQETPPVFPVYGITVDVPGVRADAAVRLLSTGELLPTEPIEGGIRVQVPRLDVFHIFEIDG